MTVTASAPSNIALIKYMGKVKDEVNFGVNHSLSYTLSHLVTEVELSPIAENEKDRWEPLVKSGFLPLQLSTKGVNRYLQFFHLLKSRFQIEGQYLVRSANNFPSDCGIASSASSFAALTLGAYRLAESLQMENFKKLSQNELAQISRLGSGSSCRSFFEPFCLWTDEVKQLSFPIHQLHHQIVLVESKEKEVSSSEAHKRVLTSELFTGRKARAETRLKQLLAAFDDSDWERLFELTWADFWDMHALFETSSPSFGYFTAESFQVLAMVRNFWKEKKDGPLVTMDAGANIHLLYRLDQGALAQEIQRDLTGLGLRVVSSPSLVEVDS